MQLTERTIVRRSSPQWEVCDRLTFLSKNLYNAALYDVRQHFFDTGKHKSWQTQRKEFVRDNQPDYRALPAKVAGETVMLVGRNFNSFFGLLRAKKKGDVKTKVRIPSYAPKNGRMVVTFPKDTLSTKKKSRVDARGRTLYRHLACVKDLAFEVISRHETLDLVRIVPKGNHFVVEAVYTVSEKSALPDNGRYAAIDLGVNNLVTLVSNVTEPVIFGGGAVKSINQYYNKRRARLASELPKGVHWSKRLQILADKRACKMDWELHEVASRVVNHLVANRISTLVVGYNSGWKQDIDLGKRNNQNFIFIPFARLVELLRYRCEKEGITLVVTEESYTSKCSALDGEKLGKHDSYLGRRVKRGLFRASSGQSLNADVNGAWNVLRKVVPDKKLKGIEALAIGPVRTVKTCPTKTRKSS